tara:strand:+ start:313 stop:981 length:669 start_codon:yes stop_codon:yes gene_type:complete
MKIIIILKYIKIILLFLSIILSSYTLFFKKRKIENYKINNINDKIIYIDNFLNKNEIDKILNNIKNIKNLKNEKFRLIKPLDNDINKEIYDIFYSYNNLNKLKKKLKNNKILKSDFPIEYRIYPNKSDGMKLHSDILLYDLPQYEAIYTINNTSDSKTKWIDSNNKINEIWTKPNSLLIIKANGYKHLVTPINKGERSIFKLIYTQSNNTNNNYDRELLRFI